MLCAYEYGCITQSNSPNLDSSTSIPPLFGNSASAKSESNIDPRKVLPLPHRMSSSLEYTRMLDVCSMYDTEDEDRSYSKG